MINSLNIGAYVFDRLSNELDDIKVCPIVVEKETTFPYIVYKRIGLVPASSKDGEFEDTARIEVKVVTENYADGIEIANQVRESLEVDEDTFDGMGIETTLENGTEEYAYNAYIQTLIYKIKIN